MARFSLEMDGVLAGLESIKLTETLEVSEVLEPTDVIETDSCLTSSPRSGAVGR
ncbi:hypothetical protein ACFQMM_15595 [Saliphagus sp. GCM10025308]